MKGTTKVTEMEAYVVDAVSRIRPVLIEAELEYDWATVETFIAIALRVIAKTHPSKVREEARLVEIQARMRPGVKKQ